MNGQKHGIQNLIDYDRSVLLYKKGEILNPFTQEHNEIIFADDVASGRPCKLIEEYIINNVYPYYSNTHSNATCGIMMKEEIQKVRKTIRKLLNLSDHHKIIFTGNGCTGAINHFIGKIDFTKHKKVNVYLSEFEHHSNFLPWLKKIDEVKKDRFEIKYIESKGMDIDFDQLIHALNQESQDKDVLNIVSLIGCSNVDGKRYDTNPKLWNFVQEKRDSGSSIYLLYDMACSAPYVDIDLQKCDGIYFSPHKFLGGQSTPGVLIVHQDLLETNKPYAPGGGCVQKADRCCVVYKEDLEAREMAGTPNIVGIIRLGRVLVVKEALKKIINYNEHILSKHINEFMKKLTEKYPNFHVMGLDSMEVSDLPIYPVIIDQCHYNLLVKLFNDIYGIQTRGGISCCGMLGEMCLKRYGVKGWCRISFNYLLSQEEVNKILQALEYLIVNWKQYEDRYQYDKQSNLFMIKE